MSKNIETYIVYSPNGSIDIDSTKRLYENKLLEENLIKLNKFEADLDHDKNVSLNKFEKDLNSYIENKAAWNAKSAEAIDHIFSTYGEISGGSILKSTLVSMAANYMLSAGMIEYTKLNLAEAMVSAYISDNEGSLFIKNRGKGGGIKRA